MKQAKDDKLYLVDTNIWLDYFFSDRPSHKEAFAFVDFAFSCNINLLYAVTSLKDIFYIAQNKVKNGIRAEKGELSQTDALAAAEFAWGVITSVSENAVAVGADSSDVWLALKQRAFHNDFEDNIILAAAERSNASFLITNDELLIKHATVPALTSKDALSYLQMKRDFSYSE